MSSSVSVTTATVQLAAPAPGFSATSSSITLSWSAISNATSYSITQYAANGTTIISTISTANLTYTISALNPGTAFIFTVTAIGVGAYANSSPSLPLSYSTLSAVLAAPTGAALSSVTSNSFVVSFTGSSNATGYTVNVYSSSVAPGNLVASISNFVSGTSVSNLPASTLLVVTVTANGDGVHYTDSPASSSVSTTTAAAPLLPQTVSFYTSNAFTATTSTSTVAYTKSGTYTVYAKGSANGAITFSSLTTNVCTVVAATGVVTTVAAGSCVLSASAAGVAGYLSSATSATLSLTITPIAQTISYYTDGTFGTVNASNTASVTAPTGSSLANLGTYQLYARGSGTDVASAFATTTFSTSTSSICTVNSSSGFVTIVSVGTCLVSVYANAVGGYAQSGLVNFTLNVLGTTPTIAFYANSGFTGGAITTASAALGSGPYQAYAQSQSSGTLTYATTSLSSICTVNSTGAVTLVGAGVCNVTVSSGAVLTQGWLTSLTATLALTISTNLTANTITVTSTAPTNASVSGATYLATATVTSGTVSITTSGACTGSGTGSATITFNNGSGTCTVNFTNTSPAVGYATAAPTSQVFTVAPTATLPNTITVTSTNPGTAQAGTTYNASATVTSGTVSITTSGACTGSGTGSATITFVGPGTSCSVIFTNTGAAVDYVTASQVTQSVTVTLIANTITITSTAPTSPSAGTTYNATATVTSGTVSITTSGACTGSGTGSATITFVGPGTSCSVIFTNTGAAVDYVTASQVTQSVTVTLIANTITITSTAPTSPSAGTTYNAIATVTSGTVSITSSGACTGSGTGSATITFVGPGTSCTVSFANTGNAANYAVATTKTQAITIVLLTNTITPSTAPSTGSVGGTYSASGTTTSGGSVTIATSGGACTGSGTGSATVSFSAAGTCTVTLTSAATGNYAAATTVTQNIAVSGGGTFTITYSTNGGTGSVPTQAAKASGVTITVAFSPLPTRTNYTFVGWSQSATGSATYTLGGARTFVMPAANVTLYAIWGLTRTVTYNVNGGTGSVPAPASYGSGATVTVLFTPLPTRTGQVFAGWSTSTTGSALYTVIGTKTFVISANTTLNAVWVTSGTAFTVAFNGNGSMSGTMAIESFVVGTAKTLTTRTYNRTNYTFLGWATSTTGPVVYTNGQSITVTANLTLYAIWASNTVTVSFNASGGTGTMANQSFTYGASAKALSANAFAFTGLTFQGWATTAGGPVVYTNSQSLSLVSATTTLTLYAVWG